MTAPTLVPILGSVIDGKITKGETDDPITVITANGFVITLNGRDLQAAQLVQGGTDPSQSLYRLFVTSDACVSVKLKASSWAALDAASESGRAKILDSGASKTIEDTA